LLGLIVNVSLFQASPIALWGALDIIMIVLPVCAFFARSREIYSAITLLYVPLSAADLAVSLAH
jgi:hypothetical protein